MSGKREENRRIARLVWRKYGENRDQDRTDALGKATQVKWDLVDSVLML